MESQYATELQNILLSWDYWHLERLSRDGKGPIDTLPIVPQKFSTVEEYVSTFEKLLLEECSALLLRGQEEGQILVSQQAVGARAESALEGCIACRLTLPLGVSDSFAENDVVLVSQEDPHSLESADELHHALALVEGREAGQSVRVRFNLSPDAQAGNKEGLLRISAMAPLLQQDNSRWWVLKLANTSTVQREWAALHSLKDSPLRDVVLSAMPLKSPVLVDKLCVPKPMMTVLNSAYNASQLEAITAGLQGTSLVLVQGPPGTGKTTTILGLLAIVMHAAPLGAFGRGGTGTSNGSKKDGKVDGSVVASTLQDRQRAWLQASPWLRGIPDPRSRSIPPEQADPEACFGMHRAPIPVRIGSAQGPTARILICAPANSALDELVLRIISSGLTDKEGRVFMPNIVRFGLNVHHSVKSVSLETLVEQRLASGGKEVSKKERARVRMAILEEANIVCSTLAFSGSHAFTRLTKKFDIVIIDEAAQAVEPSTLVPLTTGDAKQVYLVGDPVQLPATVLSQRAVAHGYNTSMFKRLQSAGYPVQMLTEQYRMHPIIREFPSRMFYEERLLDGDKVATSTARPWHECVAFQPLMFYDVRGKESTPEGSNSLRNEAEAKMALAVYRELVHRYPALGASAMVAAISPYKAQVNLLKEMFKQALGPDASKLVDINSIDGFQGREKDVVIFSTVRSSKRGSIGFVADLHRMNVGLTRARSALILVGNARALQQDAMWKALIEQTLALRCCYAATEPFVDCLEGVIQGSVLPATKQAVLVSPPAAKASKAAQAEAVEEEAQDAFLYSEDEDTLVQPTTVKQSTWAKRQQHQP